MSKPWVLCITLCVYVSVVRAGDFGYGQLEIMAINKCEQENHTIKFDLEPVQINETHAGCRGQIVLTEPFTKDIGMRVKICKYVEDEWKQVLVLSETSVFNFFSNYVEEDKLKAWFAAAGIDPPELPIAEGEYDVSSFAIEMLPMNGMYGDFESRTYLLKGEEEIGCIEMASKFYEVDKEEEK